MTSASRRLDRLIARRDRLNLQIGVAEREAQQELRARQIQEFCATAFLPPYDPRRPVAGNHEESLTMRETVSPFEQRRLEAEALHSDAQGAEISMLKDMLKDADAKLRSMQDNAAHNASWHITVDIRKARRMTHGLLTVLSGAFDDEREQIAEEALRFAVRVLRRDPLARLQKIVETAHADANGRDDAEDLF